FQYYRRLSIQVGFRWKCRKRKTSSGFVTIMHGAVVLCALLFLLRRDTYSTAAHIISEGIAQGRVQDIAADALFTFPSPITPSAARRAFLTIYPTSFRLKYCGLLCVSRMCSQWRLLQLSTPERRNPAIHRTPNACNVADLVLR